MRNTESRLLGTVLFLLGLLAFQSVHAEQVGQITDLHAETRTVRIDGQAYALSPDAELGYEGQPGRLVALQHLKRGQPVTFEAEVGSDGDRVITRLMLLSE